MPQTTFDSLLACPDDRQPAIDFEHPIRRQRLTADIQARIGSPSSRTAVPGQTVLEQASDRYFALIASAQRSLRGRFTESEWDIMLNVECSPIWQWDARNSMASMVADDLGVESLEELEPESSLRQLFAKLVKLSPLENAALVDACEQVWRGAENPLLEA